MMRRSVITLAALPMLARAQPGGFADELALGSDRLIRNGIGERRYLGVLVYRAALYLTAPSHDARAILEAGAPKVLRLAYARAVPAQIAVDAWHDSYGANCRCAAPPALLDWVRDLAAGDVESYAIMVDHARLAGPRRPEAILAGAPAARDLLACWLGPAPPSEPLKRGLLGLVKGRAAASYGAVGPVSSGRGKA